MAFSSDQVWAKFYADLVEYAVPEFDKDKQAVSIAGTTLYADVIDADPLISNANIYNIGNLLPSGGPSYAPGGDLINSYALFLQNVDLGGDPSQVLKDQINKAATSMNANQTNFSKVQGEAYTQYGTYITVINPSYTAGFDAWANTNYPVYAQAKSSLNAAVSDYNQLMVQAHGAGYNTLQAAQAAVSFITGARSVVATNPYNMDVKVGSVQPDGSVTVLPGQDPPVLASALKSTFRPAYGLGGGLPSVYATWQTNSVQGKEGASFALTGNFSDGNYSDFGWSAAAQASYRSWFSVKASAQASYSKVQQSWNQSSFSCTVSFNGVGQFPLTPDANWFMSGLISSYKDKLLSTSPQFFGDGGSLHVIPSSVILGFGPKITIEVANADYQSLKTAFQQSATLSIGVGPFSFGGSESSFDKNSSFTYNDNSNTIVIAPPPTNVPLLLGVVSNKY